MLALESGRGGEVQGIAEQLLRIDPSSPFAERAFTLRPALPEPVAVPAVPGLNVPAKP